MSDAYVYAVENSDDFDGVPVDVAVVPSGTVRDTYTAGTLRWSRCLILFPLALVRTACRIPADQCLSDREGTSHSRGD